MKTICVFSSSSDALSPVYFETARELAALIVDTLSHPG